MNKKIGIILLTIVGLLGCTQAKRVSPWQHFWNPTSFTPNGDGLNDSYRPIPQAQVIFTDYHIIIFDNNMQVLFESDDMYASWDPVQLNQDLPAGFYEYQITYTCSEDSVNYYDYITNSNINLIR